MQFFEPPVSGSTDIKASPNSASTCDSDRQQTKLSDLIATTLLVLIFMGVAQLHSNAPDVYSWLDIDERGQLGAEYDSIARSIRSGRGFSDPFQIETGPTAWMPPVFPYFLAAIYWLCGNQRESVIDIVVGLNGLVLIFSALIVIGFARAIRKVWVGYLVLVTFFCVNFHQLFQKSHDTFLILLILNFLIVGSGDVFRRPYSIRALLVWGTLGGFAALSSPVAGWTWAGLTTIEGFRSVIFRRGGCLLGSRTVEFRNGVYAIVLCGLVSMLVVTPWVIRNCLVMEAWIPIKSNATYEIWQAQCLSEDGLLSPATDEMHPWKNREVRAKYKSMGEMAFIEAKFPELRTAFTTAPLEVARKILNRAAAAFVFYQPHDRERRNDQFWPILIKRVFFPLPVFSLLLVFAKKSRLNALHARVVKVYFLYLIPYVLISYYDRYGAPLIVVKMLLVLMAVEVFLPKRLHIEKRPMSLSSLLGNNSGGVTSFP